MPKPPLPEAALALLRQPNPAVIAVRRPDGHPMSVATWYLLEDDGTVLVNMDAGRARLRWIQEHPFVSLTVLQEDEWYVHVSVRGQVARWEHDEQRALADIDRLARHYTGQAFGNRASARVSAWVEITHWHGWEID
ncbi:MAG TPA: TIGR03618 family F420-dependent PPOX class oxidoreductase [Nocardioides sp.]|jgi:PPOX class probable F420-dependent enzyme|uniref:TIGR03618 family F420-dependent PPOX class oxidoreductase n=1 Tax=Nocardioides sp. TaxID=35761 RepID=UPI002E34A698|nr:TIGR03618 family F420-dependent PPOX class oxidoreductase [Nocardioides sp.]HEX3930194.1 TIGR03618 family F420-dependent PPOX class oxidoreductase [Nocardioides sp.]